MRTTPYNFTTPPAPAATKAAEPVVNKQSYTSSLVDIKKEILRPASKPASPTQTDAKTAENAPTPPTQDAAPATNNGQPTTETKGTANLGEDFEKFKTKFREDGAKAIDDPKRAAATTLKFINFIRVIGYPFLMKWALFEPAEKTELEKIQAKVFEAEKQKTTDARDKVIADFTVFERRIFEKWQGFEKHKTTIAWSEAEINFLVDVGHLKMQEIAFIKWLMQNEFAMAILFIEGRRVAPVITARMGLGFIDMPNFLG